MNLPFWLISPQKSVQKGKHRSTGKWTNPWIYIWELAGKFKLRKNEHFFVAINQNAERQIHSPL
jgi:hypothetical protein